MALTKSLLRTTIALALVLAVALKTPNTITQPVNAVQTFSVAISNLAFNPQNITIQVGDTITWINNDQLIYTLWFVKTDDQTTYDKAGTEGLSDPISPGASWSETFNELVTLKYHSFERLWITGFITVTPPIPPAASFTFSPSTPFEGQTITFDASASRDLDGTITQYSWDFDDDTKVNETDPISTHSYVAAGTYTVALTVTDDDEQTESTNRVVIVNPIIHDIIVVSVSLFPTEVTEGEDVSITVVVRNDGNVTESFDVTAYYDDTAIGAEEVPGLTAGSTVGRSFTWNTSGVAEGEYTIKAIASTVAGETDEADNVGTALTYVVVKSPPPPFPTVYLVAISIVIVAIIGALTYVYLRRKKESKT